VPHSLRSGGLWQFDRLADGRQEKPDPIQNLPRPEPPGSRPYDHDGWAVATKHRICRHQRQRFLQRLRDEQAVEWVLVQLRQRLHTNGVCRPEVEKALTRVDEGAKGLR